MIDQRNKKCHACGEDAKSICSGCRIVYFCSKECQVSAWPSHKGKCKAAKKEAKEHLADMWDAAHTGNIAELRKYLAKYPSAVNMVYTRNFGIMTVSRYCLDIAASNGHLEAVKLLIANGADILLGDPDYGQLPIHRACDNGHTEVVKYLLEKGSPIWEGDGMGQTPLHFAAEHGHTELCQFLLDNGAKPSLKVLYRGKTPKVWAQNGGHSECAALL